jgi:acylphosphatase
MKHLNIRVSGKVQGVFFRASAKEQADKLGVKGFVRNEPTGEVYIEAEANEEKIELILQWCAQGPRNARVDHITSEESSLVKYGSFEVRRSH